MRTKLLFYLTMLLIVVTFGFSADQTLILSGGPGFTFQSATLDQPESEGDELMTPMMSFQYTRHYSSRLDFGLRMMVNHFENSENNLSDGSGISLPLLAALEYTLPVFSNISHVQFAAGPSFQLQSLETASSEKDSLAFSHSGYGMGLFNSYRIGVYGPIDAFAEVGVLYDFSGLSSLSNGKISALVNIGFSLNRK